MKNKKRGKKKRLESPPKFADYTEYCRNATHCGRTLTLKTGPQRTCRGGGGRKKSGRGVQLTQRALLGICLRAI